METFVIVGRPNVGKSTLFNRLVGQRLAMVHDSPGVTRDWREGTARLGDLSFTLVDTAGVDDWAGKTLDQDLFEQTEHLLRRARACFFVYDARAGLGVQDDLLGQWLRKQGVKVIVLANKCEGDRVLSALSEGYRLGFGEPIAFSGAHGLGLEEMYEALRPLLSSSSRTAFDEKKGLSSPLKVAIIGRPNAGKSTLVNHLLGETRFMTGPEAGVTREAIGAPWHWNEHAVLLWDTPGIRRKSRVEEDLESLSVQDALRALGFAEVVVLLLDSTRSFEKQDMLLADLALREGRALVIACNKWDQMPHSHADWQALSVRIEEALPQARGVELVRLSGLSGYGVSHLMPAILRAYEAWNKRYSTGKLNRWLEEVTTQYAPPAQHGRRLKIKYMTQIKARPPTFVLFCSQEGGIPESYLRYLTNRLREDFDLKGVPIRFHVRKPKNPYRQTRG